MRLLISSCLIVLFSVSAQAYEKIITIEAEVKTQDMDAPRSVWAADDVKLITNGYSQCKIVYGLLELNCSATTTDSDSLRDSKTTIKMDDNNFRVLAWAAAHNSDISKASADVFYKNIHGYSTNHDSMVPKAAVEFQLFGKITQETLFYSQNYGSLSRIRVTQH